jgi:short-subunit dehydrogenase
VRDLARQLEALGTRVDILVNNAGVATSGPFQSQAPGTSRDIMRVNMTSLVELTEHLLPGMIERGMGRILNVASVAGFQAVPGIALYSATKAFVLSFSEGLAEDLRGTGVTVTALCPGPTRTEMVADIEPMELAGPFMASAREVAQEGYRACMAGEVVRVPGLVNQAMVTWLQYQPRWLVRLFSGMAARSTFGASAVGNNARQRQQKGADHG